jgi:signal transduction histidine kinase
LNDVQVWFARLRYLVGAVLALSLLMGGATGLVLAGTLVRPLQKIRQAVHQLTSDQRLEPLPESGPQEIRLLAQAVNDFGERRSRVETTNRQLLSNLLHEVGRPLGACYAAIQALRDGDVEPLDARSELLAGMGNEVQSLQRLLNDLSQLDIDAQDQSTLQRRPVDVSHWLMRLSGPWREAAHTKGLHWEIDVPADLPQLFIDPERLGQALGNLLSNAIKFTPRGGSVSLRADIVDKSLRICVSDTGPGIATADHAHLFTPFYRVQDADPSQTGMGLGLSIARDLVRAHGGRLKVESRPGAGSHFTISLPLDAERGARQKTAGNDPEHLARASPSA